MRENVGMNKVAPQQFRGHKIKAPCLWAFDAWDNNQTLWREQKLRQSTDFYKVLGIYKNSCLISFLFVWFIKRLFLKVKIEAEEFRYKVNVARLQRKTDLNKF